MEIILYLEVNLVCIAILFTVYVRDLWERNNDTYHVLFTRVLFANILFFVADILWGLMSLTTHPHIWQNWVINILYFSMSGVAAYFWLSFVEGMINPKSAGKSKYPVLRMLPFLLLILLSIISYKTHWLFYIDAVGHYCRGSMFFLQPFLAYLLPVYATVKALLAMKKSINFEKKRQYRSLALFYVLPAIGGIGQVLIEGTPMLNIGIALSGLWVYFSFQDNMIMLDPLTAMNNRRFFDKTLDSLIHNYDDTDKYLWLILMDVDYFKKINDCFGHAEGDRALITIADVLKDVCGEFNCTAARIGGDEFAVSCESDDESFPEWLYAIIEQRLSEKTSQYPFKLKLSMGYSKYCDNTTPQQLYISADKKLYDVKKSR